MHFIPQHQSMAIIKRQSLFRQFPSVQSIYDQFSQCVHKIEILNKRILNAALKSNHYTLDIKKLYLFLQFEEVFSNVDYQLLNDMINLDQIDEYQLHHLIDTKQIRGDIDIECDVLRLFIIKCMKWIILHKYNILATLIVESIDKLSFIQKPYNQAPMKHYIMYRLQYLVSNNTLKSLSDELCSIDNQIIFIYGKYPDLATNIESLSVDPHNIHFTAEISDYMNWWLWVHHLNLSEYLFNDDITINDMDQHQQRLINYMVEYNAQFQIMQHLIKKSVIAKTIVAHNIVNYHVSLPNNTELTIVLHQSLRLLRKIGVIYDPISYDEKMSQYDIHILQELELAQYITSYALRRPYLIRKFIQLSSGWIINKQLQIFAKFFASVKSRKYFDGNWNYDANNITKKYASNHHVQSLNALGIHIGDLYRNITTIKKHYERRSIPNTFGVEGFAQWMNLVCTIQKDYCNSVELKFDVGNKRLGCSIC